MLTLAIKSTFENTTPKDVRWRVYFIVSAYSHWKFVDNRKIRVTFNSRSFGSCRIFRICIFIISSRGYITYSDRWSGSQVSAAYHTCGAGVSLHPGLWQKIMQLYWRNKQFIAREIKLPPHFGRTGTELWSPSCADSGSKDKFELIKIEAFQRLGKLWLRLCQERVQQNSIILYANKLTVVVEFLEKDRWVRHFLVMGRLLNGRRNSIPKPSFFVFLKNLVSSRLDF